MVRWDAATGKAIGSVKLEAKNLINPTYQLSEHTTVITPDATRVICGLPCRGGRPPRAFDPVSGAELFNIPSGVHEGYCDYVGTVDLTKVVGITASIDPEVKTARCEVFDVVSRKKVKDLVLPAYNEFGDRLISPRDSRELVRARSAPTEGGSLRSEQRSLGHRFRASHLRSVRPWSSAGIWSTGKQLASLEFPRDTESGQWLTVASNRLAIYKSYNGPLRVLDFDRGEVVREFDDSVAQSSHSPHAFSPDGKTLAAATMSKDRTFGVRLYDWQNGKVLHTFEGHVVPADQSARLFSGR